MDRVKSSNGSINSKGGSSQISTTQTSKASSTTSSTTTSIQDKHPILAAALKRKVKY